MSTDKDILWEATIPIRPITKKNSPEIHQNRAGRMWIAPSKRFKEYEQQAGWYIKGTPMIDEPVNVKMVFYMPGGRVDLGNLEAGCLDLLTDYGVLKDDNCNIVCSHDGSRVIRDKENPRTEITITRATQEQDNSNAK